MQVSIERLNSPDVPALSRLVEQAGWNQLPSDWLRLIELEPDGCFAARLHGELVATLTTVCYGSELAWIGMMLVDQRFRRQGIARQMMEHAVETLKGRSIRTVQLDATPLGKRLYEQLGFRTEFAFHRWHRAGGACRAQSIPQTIRAFSAPAKPMLLATHHALDRESFGADRAALLQRLASVSQVATFSDGSFGMLRGGRIADYLGPVSSTEQAAASLVEQLVESTDRDLFWDIPSQNAMAVYLANHWQFAPVRTLFRMTLGPSPQPLWASLFALADPALG